MKTLYDIGPSSVYFPGTKYVTQDMVLRNIKITTDQKSMQIISICLSCGFKNRKESETEQ